MGPLNQERCLLRITFRCEKSRSTLTSVTGTDIMSRAELLKIGNCSALELHHTTKFWWFRGTCDSLIPLLIPFAAFDSFFSMVMTKLTVQRFLTTFPSLFLSKTCRASPRYFQSRFHYHSSYLLFHQVPICLLSRGFLSSSQPFE